MKTPRRICAGLALLVAAGLAPAMEVTPVAQARVVIQRLYSLDHDGAEAECRRLIQANPQEAVGHAMLARTIWARILNNERALDVERLSDPLRVRSLEDQIKVTPEESARFLSASQRAIELARARVNADPKDREALLLLGFAYLNLGAFQYSVAGEIWKAYRSGEQAVAAHRKLMELEPGSADAHMAIGMALYLADVLPWRVKWLAILFGFSRGREQGKREIEVTAKDGYLLADDARSMLVVLHERDQRLDEAAGPLRELRQRYPRNYIVHLELASVLVKLGRAEEALKMYRVALAKAAGRRDGYERVDRPGLLMSMGLASREAGRLEESAALLKTAVSHPGASGNQRVLARLSLGQSLERMGKQEEAAACYRAVAAAEDVDGSRRLARSRLERGALPR